MTGQPTSSEAALPAAGGRPAVSVHAETLGPFETNCYVLWTPGSSECWIIDAGFAPGRLIDAVRSRDLRPSLLVLTHAHADHIAGIPAVVKAFPGLPVAVHADEADWLADPERNLSLFSGFPVSVPGPDRVLRAGDKLRLGTSSWEVRHTPGHSPGGITLVQEPVTLDAGVAFVGDALFAGSVGRTDFPGSDPEVLANAIRTQLYVLPDSTRVLPGHGPSTTIGRERRSNPYVRS